MKIRVFLKKCYELELHLKIRVFSNPKKTLKEFACFLKNCHFPVRKRAHFFVKVRLSLQHQKTRVFRWFSCKEFVHIFCFHGSLWRKLCFFCVFSCLQAGKVEKFLILKFWKLNIALEHVCTRKKTCVVFSCTGSNRVLWKFYNFTILVNTKLESVR